MMMATHLQRLLRSLCWETEWDYAVFWKLKCRDRMVLTWEDCYFKNQNKLDPSESKSFNGTFDGLQDGHFAHDSLSLAVSKMSYHVYSLGEGAVGQVAITGKHQWIFAGEHAMNSYSSLELCNGWEAQVAAGIKTVVVAAVLPHGVIQLGSLNKVYENLQFLDHIRDAFSSFQESVFQIPTPTQFNLQHMSQMSDISRIFSPDVLQDYLLDEPLNMEQNPSISADVQSLLRHFDHSQTSMPYVHLNEAVGSICKDGLSETINDANNVDSSFKIQNGSANDNIKICYPSQSCITVNNTLYDGKFTGEKVGTRFKHSPTDYCEAAAFSTTVFNGGSHSSKDMISEPYASDPLAKHMVEDKLEVFPEFDCLETSGNLKTSFMFSAGTELHEALGPAFFRQCYSFPHEVKKPEDRSDSQMPEATENSMLTSDSCKDHLLEAVVANFCPRDALKKSNSFSTSDSMLTSERMPEPYTNTGHALGSTCYPLGLNAPDSCSIRSSTSECKKQLDMSVEPGKPNKKRARPGENSRPRPRDRQLIQDRIKELRELVPNGSKCSIDSLLERTIKHMAFMQNVTKHSDKLSDRAKSKGCSEMGARGSGDEQGSSWAVEVGGHMKICPILVKDLNINGQMLIEMLCEDCDHFLEITDTIRGLGLTILKGITDRQGDKTWMRFVVEGQNNRKLHRMEVLWSLIHILQSKTTV